MKIAVYGDSFANKNWDSGSWWQMLHSNHGHQVTSYGTEGSSILYSADLLRQHSHKYDFNIWCLTIPGRFSVRLSGDEYFHSTYFMNHQGDLTGKQNHEYQYLIDACHNYLKYVFDDESENLVGQALSEYFLSNVSNLMVLPCFIDPLNSTFNLYEVCIRELQVLFPRKQVHEIYEKYNDKRVCHLTKKNNAKLAELISRSMSPGIFSTSYDNFSYDDIELNEILEKL